MIIYKSLLLQHFFEVQTREFTKSLLKMETFFEYMEREPQMPPDGHEKPNQLQAKLEFRNVSFTYTARPQNQVLKVRQFHKSHNKCFSHPHIDKEHHSFITASGQE